MRPSGGHPNKAWTLDISTISTRLLAPGTSRQALRDRTTRRSLGPFTGNICRPTWGCSRSGIKVIAPCSVILRWLHNSFFVDLTYHDDTRTVLTGIDCPTDAAADDNNNSSNADNGATTTGRQLRTAATTTTTPRRTKCPGHGVALFRMRQVRRRDHREGCPLPVHHLIVHCSLSHTCMISTRALAPFFMTAAHM